MKCVVLVPFLWFKKGQEVDLAKYPRLDLAYLVKKGVVETATIKEPAVEKRKRRKPVEKR